MQTTAIILAGGKSKRMGTDKALLEIDGVSLLEKSIALCKQVCDTIIISSNNMEHNSFGYPVIADEVKNCGPLSGIFSCLKRSATDWNFVISVDAAFVELALVKYLLSEASNFDAIVPTHEKGKEPLIALYNKSCLLVLEEKLKDGDYKLHNLLDSINTKFVDAQNWVEEYPSVFKNLNYPEDI